MLSFQSIQLSLAVMNLLDDCSKHLLSNIKTNQINEVNLVSSVGGVQLLLPAHRRQDSSQDQDQNCQGNRGQDYSKTRDLDR